MKFAPNFKPWLLATKDETRAILLAPWFTREIPKSIPEQYRTPDAGMVLATDARVLGRFIVFDCENDKTGPVPVHAFREAIRRAVLRGRVRIAHMLLGSRAIRPGFQRTATTIDRREVSPGCVLDSGSKYPNTEPVMPDTGKGKWFKVSLNARFLAAFQDAAGARCVTLTICKDDPSGGPIHLKAIEPKACEYADGALMPYREQ